jgi:IclR family transcriptional regulator, KDG regulon repressor
LPCRVLSPGASIAQTGPVTDRHYLQGQASCTSKRAPGQRRRSRRRAWEAGQGYRQARDLALIADEHLRAARTELNETIQLGVLEGVEVLYIAKVDADRPFRLMSRAGMRLPTWATGLGKVLLTYLPPDELRQRMQDVVFKRFTENTIATMPEIEQVLAQIRADGTGRDFGEHTAFVYCVAAPVRDESGKVIAAMSCALPEPPERRPGGYPHMAEVIGRHAGNLSKRLGYDGVDGDQRRPRCRHPRPRSH